MVVTQASLLRHGLDSYTRGDALTYIETSRNLLQHGAFTAAGQPEIMRTPGYPLFLGVATLAGPQIAVLSQVILSALTVLLVWRLARAIFQDDRIALASAWIFAFEPLSIFNCVLLQAETVFLALFLLFLERMVQFLRDHRLGVLAQAGLWLAAATFVRPVTYYLPWALALGLLVVLVRVPSLRWKAPALLLLTVLPWLAAWQVRNKIQTGFAGFTSVAVEDLYLWQAAEIIAETEHKPFFEVRHETGIRVHALAMQNGWNRAQQWAYEQSETRRILREHFGLFLLSWAKGSIRVVFSPGTTDLMSQMVLVEPREVMQMRAGIHDQGPLHAAFRFAQTHLLTGMLTAVLELLLVGTYFFAARGIVRGGAPAVCLWFLLGISLYFIALSGGALAGGRYRQPIMPIFCIFAAAGIQRTRRAEA